MQRFRLQRLQHIFQQVEQEILEDDAKGPEPEVAAAEVERADDVKVVVGTTAMAEADDGLVDQITRVINRAYTSQHLSAEAREAGQEVERVDEDDVMHRLQMGDDGPRANRGARVDPNSHQLPQPRPALHVVLSWCRSASSRL